MAGESVVSLRLRVLQEGLANLDSLIAGLGDAGTEAGSLAAEAATLRQQVQQLAAQTGANAGAQTDAAEALSQAEAAMAAAASRAQALAQQQRGSASAAQQQGQAERQAADASTASGAAMARATSALQAAERAAKDAAVAKNSLIPADTKAAEAALANARAQVQQASNLQALEAAAKAAAAGLLRAGEESSVLAREVRPEPVAQLAQHLRKLGSAIDPAVAARAQELAAELERLGARRDAEQTFQGLAKASAQARAELLTAESALEAYRATHGTTAESAAAFGARERELERAAIAARTAYTQASGAMAQGAQAARSAGVDVEAVANAQSRAAAEAQQAGQAARAAGAAQAQGAREATAAQAPLAASLQQVHGQLRAVAAAASAAVGGQLLGGLAGDLAKTADEAANLQARVRLVTGEGAAFQTAWRGVNRVALETHSSLAGTAELFARIAQAGKEMQLGQEQALALTRTINQAIQIGGASAQASDAAVTQLLQAFASGTLRGEEFNSVMEQAPRLAQALAAGLGVTTGELRKLAEAGELSTRAVVGALSTQSAALETEFSKMPKTVSRALTDLSTRWSAFISDANQATGGTAALASGIDFLGRHLEELASLLYAAGKAAVAWQVLKLWASFQETRLAAQGAAMGIAAATEATAANATVAAAAARAGAANAGALAAQATQARGLAALGGGPAGWLVAIISLGPMAAEWIGKTAAGIAGWRKVTDEANASIEASERRLKAIQEQAKQIAPNIGALVVQYAKLAEQNTKAIELAEKQDKAQQAEAQTLKALAGLYGDSARALELTNTAAQKSAETAELAAQAHEREAATLTMQVADMARAAAVAGDVSRATKDQIKALEQKRDASLAEAQAARASAEGAKVEAQERALAIAKTSDNSRAIDNMRAAYEAAEKNVARLTELERLGWVTRKEVDQATRLAAAAYQLYNDAMQDAIRNGELLIKQHQADAYARVQKIQAAKDEADVARRVAEAEGDGRAVTEAVVRGKWAEIDAVRENVRARTREAELNIEMAEAQKRLIIGTDDVSAAKRRELDISIQTERVKIKEAQASGRVTDALFAELDAYERAHQAYAAGIEIVDALTGARDRERDAIDRQVQAQNRLLDSLAAEKALRDRIRNVDANGFAKDSTGTTVVNAEGATPMSIINALKGYGLTDEQAAEAAAEFVQNGQVRFDSQYGANTLSEALRRAAEKRLTATPLNTAGTRSTGTGGGAAATAAPAAADQVASIRGTAGAGQVVQIKMLGGETRSLTLASADQVGTLSEILAAVGQAKRTSAPVVGG